MSDAEEFNSSDGGSLLIEAFCSAVSLWFI